MLFRLSTVICIGVLGNACTLVGTGGPESVPQSIELPAPPPTRPSTAPLADDPKERAELDSLTKELGGERRFSNGVYTITLPRNDLNVMTDMGDIPVEAGLESHIHFFRCSCGKLKVVGDLVVVDYELSKVIEAISSDGKIDVVSVAGMFFGETPRLVSLHFQGEGEDTSLVKAVAGTMAWMGQARSAPEPIAMPRPAR